MPDEQDVQTWTMTVIPEALAQFTPLEATFHGDLYDDSEGSSPGRIASFEVERGKLVWWNWRTPDACSRSAWPLRLVLEFEGDERRVVNLREHSWDVARADGRVRSVRL